MAVAQPNGRLAFPTAPSFPTDAAPVRSPRPRTPPTAAKDVARAPRARTLGIVGHDDGWALMIDDVTLPAWTMERKRDARQAALLAAVKHSAVLNVHTRKGDLVEVIDFSGAREETS